MIGERIHLHRDNIQYRTVLDSQVFFEEVLSVGYEKGVPPAGP